MESQRSKHNFDGKYVSTLSRQEGIEVDGEQSGISFDKMEVSLNSSTTKNLKSKEAKDKKAYRRAVNYCSSFS